MYTQQHTVMPFFLPSSCLPGQGLDATGSKHLTAKSHRWSCRVAEGQHLRGCGLVSRSPSWQVLSSCIMVPICSSVGTPFRFSMYVIMRSWWDLLYAQHNVMSKDQSGIKPPYQTTNSLYRSLESSHTCAVYKDMPMH